MTLKHSAIYLCTGLISGVLCWTGIFFLPDTSLALMVYPGIIFGLALFLCGMWVGAIPKSHRVWAGLLLVVVTIVGWRLPVALLDQFGDTFRDIIAGAIGALVVALGLRQHGRHRKIALLLFFGLPYPGRSAANFSIHPCGYI